MIDKNYAGLDGFVWWMGVVENRDDPLKLGRCQVRIYSWQSEDLSDIPSTDLPWAHPVNALNTGTFTTPKESDMVFGFFADGKNAQIPIMFGTVPNFNSVPANGKLGFNDIRSLDKIKVSPKKIVSRTYKTDGSGVVIGEANTANTDVLESLRYPHEDDVESPSPTGLSRNAPKDYDLIAARKKRGNQFVETADSKQFIEPVPPYAPQYPFNQVLDTESGHVLEFDDTPGKERVSLSHRSGSFVEYFPSGTKVEEIVKNSYKVVMSDDHIHIMGHVFVSIDSDVYIRAKGDVFVEGGNNLDVKVSGKMNLSVGEELNIKAKSLNIDIEKEAAIISGGNQNFTSTKDVNIFADGDTNIESLGDTSLIGENVNINSGGMAEIGIPAGIDSPAARMTKNDNPQSVDGPTGFEMLAFSDDSDISLKEHNAILKSMGLPEAKPETVESTGEAASPPPGGTAKEVVCGTIKLQDDYKQVKVSKNFTLADFTQGGSRKLVEQYGVTEAELLCNVVKLAENILEPIRAAGYTFIITSGYRRGATDLPAAAISSRTGPNGYKPSDHDLARAVDITQIKKNGQPISTYQAAVEMFSLIGKISKQFLLEYNSSGGGASGWVHIAYSDTAPQSAMHYGTLLDNKTKERLKFVNLRSA